MTYLQLFLSFLQIGLLSFGGGYAALPLIKGQVIDQMHWMTQSEFNDLVTISQMTPGPIAVNAATFVGQKVAGMPGAVVATAGCIMPSCLIVSLLVWLYFRFRSLSVMQEILQVLRPAVVALIAGAGVSIFLTAVLTQKGGGIRPLQLLLFFGAFFLLQRKKQNPILVMLLCGMVNLFFQCCW